MSRTRSSCLALYFIGETGRDKVVLYAEEIKSFLEENEGYKMKKITKQQIDKLLSFKHGELASWVNSILHGDDKDFPIAENCKSIGADFLTDAYENIVDYKFRDNFLEILHDLVDELSGYTLEKIKKEAGYIYQLLSLCASIKEFEDTDILYEIAVSGDLKGVKAGDMELHQVLLKTLASFKLTGDYEFWFKQLRDTSNKYYAYVAIHALIKREYRLDIIFRGIEIFIARFKDSWILFIWVFDLLKYFEADKIINHLKAIDYKLTEKQEEAVDKAFIIKGCSPLFQVSPLEGPVEIKVRKLSSLDYPVIIEELNSLYQSTVPLAEKAIKVLNWMDFKMELNLEIHGHSIAAFIKKKNMFENFYEYWVCFFEKGKQKTVKDKVLEAYHITEALKKDLEKKSTREKYDDFRCLVVSERGFTKAALKLQEKYSIDLLTVDELFSSIKI